MKQHLKAVLFDLDGTLINSEHFYFQNWQPILAREFNYHINFEDWIRDFAGHTLAHNVERLIRDFGFNTTEEFMWKATRAAYAASDMTQIELMPGAVEILDFLKAQNIKIVLVTSSYKTTVDTVLGHHKLLHYFDFFITRESVKQAKPNPEPYLLALEKLNFKAEECVAIEDTITGYTAAIGAGIPCIAVTKQAAERAKLTAVENIVENLFSVQQQIAAQIEK